MWSGIGNVCIPTVVLLILFHGRFSVLSCLTFLLSSVLSLFFFFVVEILHTILIDCDHSFYNILDESICFVKMISI